MWKAKGAIGTATVGSSEAVLLGGLAMKKRWQAKMKAQGKDTSRPNIVMGNNAQVALEKFARYFDVECRLIPVSAESHYCLDIAKAAEACDENTIGVYVILGSTYTGHFEDVEGMSKELDRIQQEKGWDIPIHVDAASGGFVAPFAFPKLKWSFEVPRVKSINTSGHKYGLAYPGIGWILWKSEDFLPKELVFTLTYLGAEEQTFTLNFSRPACFMVRSYDIFCFVLFCFCFCFCILRNSMACILHFFLILVMVTFRLLNTTTLSASASRDTHPLS
jgi:glutamate decarboxylase